MRLIKIKLALLFLLGLSGMQAQSIYVRDANGKQSSYAFNSIKKLSFQTGNLLIQTNTETKAYPFNALRYYNFTSLATGIFNAQQNRAGLTVFPNPVLDVLNLEFDDTYSSNSTIQIFSIDGKNVGNQIFTSNNTPYQINVSHLPKGLYVCQKKNKEGVSTVKFIKQ